MLTAVNAFSRERLTITVARKRNRDGMLATLTERFIERGLPEQIRSDQRQEFVAPAVKAWLDRIGVTALYIEETSPWKNGSVYPPTHRSSGAFRLTGCSPLAYSQRIETGQCPTPHGGPHDPPAPADADHLACPGRRP